MNKSEKLLKEKDVLQEAKLKALREAIQKGVDSGEAVPLDMDKVIEKAHKRAGF